MAMLKKAENKQAFLKAGILGFPGSGKTFTASMLAIGIAKRLGNGKPVAFFDTESGSDFLIPRFEAEGVELMTVKSHSFNDLMATAREAESTCSVLIVDSISHVWRELMESFKKKLNVRKLKFNHWDQIKSEWFNWTHLYLNSNIHIFVLGRAGYEYDFESDEKGDKELVKVGTKMKVESEFGFEPSLLIEMERVAKSSEPGAGWIHRAHILKDRTDMINGKAFDFEKPHQKYKVGDWSRVFKPFQPVFDSLNIGGEHVGISTQHSSEELFDSNGDGAAGRRARRALIATEEIQGALVAIWPGQDAASKKAKQDVIEAVFGTRSWTSVEGRSVEALEKAVKVFHSLETALKQTPQAANDLMSCVRSCIDSIEKTPLPSQVEASEYEKQQAAVTT